MERVVLIDGLPMVYAIHAKLGHLCTSTKIPTGTRYGVIRAVRKYHRDLEATRTVICWDTQAPVIKAEGVPEYKANRTLTEAKADMYAQVPGVKEMLALTKFSQIEVPGYEADDIIGTLARKFEAEGCTVRIVTPDHDLLQAVTDQVHLIDPKERDGKKDKEYGPEDVLKEKGVLASNFLLWKALKGDNSDNVKGVDIGEAQLELLRKNLAERELPLEDFNKVYRDGGLFSASTVERYERNLRVLALVEPPELIVTKGKRDKQALRALFELLEFRSLLKTDKDLDDLTGVEPTNEMAFAGE